MSENRINKTGKQLDSQVLFNKQKKHMAYTDNIKIIAIDIRTPENLASIFRVADAVGCQHIVLVGEKAENQSKKFSRIARSTEQFIRLEQLTYSEFISTHDTYQPMLALEITSGSTSLFDMHLPEICSIVIGNERNGIDNKILALCQQAIHIPMYGCNGSMNVSHALAVCLYEWRRQNSLK